MLHYYRVESLATNGFALIKSVFTPPEVAKLIASLPELGGAAGTRNLLEFDWGQSLAADLRIMELVRADIGDGAVSVRGILFDKNPGANWTLGWHQDKKIAVAAKGEYEGFHAWSEKEGVIHCQPPSWVLEASLAVRIHLDPCGADNGALRVLPGSHRMGIGGGFGPDENSVLCLAEPGDILLMKPLLWHASSKAASPSHRRVIHIEYSSAVLPDGLSWAHAMVSPLEGST